jgi:hypothetical protein
MPDTSCDSRNSGVKWCPVSIKSKGISLANAYDMDEEGSIKLRHSNPHGTCAHTLMTVL